MKSMIQPVMVAISLATLPSLGAAPVFEMDFQQADVGQLPEEFLVLDGNFAVQADGDQKFLELPGAPLESFGVLFGPSAKDGLSVSARIFGTGKGRRFPAFGVSLGGVSGFKLQVSPAKKVVEIFRGDLAVTSVPYEWTSGQWTRLRLQVRPGGDAGWRIEAKVWTADQPEPSAWTVTWTTKDAPIAGRPGVWGQPFSGTPIRFDDLKVSAATSPEG